MSLIFSESFDLLTPAQLVASGKWTANSNGTSGPTGSAGRNGFGYQWNANPTNLTKQLSATDQHATLIVGMAVFITNSTAFELLQLQGDSGSTAHTTLHFSGQLLHVYRGSSGGTLLASMAAVDALAFNTWYYIELKVFLADTTGTVDLRVNGQSKISLTNQDTRNAGTAAVFNRILLRPGPDGSANTNRIDDLYICNGAGAVNSDFLGDVRVETLVPNGDGNYSQWTPKNYNRLTSANVSGIETDATGWSSDVNAQAPTRVTSPVRSGTGALQVQNSASVAGTMSVKSTQFPVSPNTSYVLGAYVRAASTTRATNIGIEWYDNGGSPISRTLSSPNTTDATSYSLFQPTVAYTSPVNAVTASLLVQWVSAATNEIHYLDDAFVMETTTTAANTSEAGSLSTHWTAVADLTTSATSGMLDASHVVGTANDLVDTWAHTNPGSPTGSTVRGVVQYAEARADTASAKSLALVSRLGTTDATSADNTLAQTYGIVSKGWDLDPDGNPWTITNVAAAEFGVKVRP